MNPIDGKETENEKTLPPRHSNPLPNTVSRGEKRSSMRKKRQRNRGQHRMTSNVFNMFNQDQIQEFKEAFKMIDQDQDGYIDGDDLKDMFLSLGKNVDESIVNDMLAEAPGPINFTMFLTLFGQCMSATDPEDTLIQAFSCLDEDGSGRISRDDMEFMMTQMGDRYTTEQFAQLFRDVSLDNEGKFDYREMAHMMKYGNPESY